MTSIHISRDLRGGCSPGALLEECVRDDESVFHTELLQTWPNRPITSGIGSSPALVYQSPMTIKTWSGYNFDVFFSISS